MGGGSSLPPVNPAARRWCRRSAGRHSRGRGSGAPPIRGAHGDGDGAGKGGNRRARALRRVGAPRAWLPTSMRLEQWTSSPGTTRARGSSSSRPPPSSSRGTAGRPSRTSVRADPPAGTSAGWREPTPGRAAPRELIHHLTGHRCGPFQSTGRCHSEPVAGCCDPRGCDRMFDGRFAQRMAAGIASAAWTRPPG